MSGQTNLQEVLNSMHVSCDDIEYGFATLQRNTPLDIQEVLGLFHEAEGLTVIGSKEFLTEQEVDFEGPYAKLSIDVHTSLELVGLTAILATKLAEMSISANVVAAYFHDHVFVQYDVRQEAIDALHSLKNV